MSSSVSTVFPLIENIIDSSTVVNQDNNLCQSKHFAAETHNALECFLFKLPFFLQDIGMGYICIAMCTVVIATSIFGNIKESYKWFILNQAIWDLLVSYDYICARPSANYWITTLAKVHENVWAKSMDKVEQTCFYSSPLKLFRFANDIIAKEACYMLFLLSFSRFLALYFHHFYERNFGTTLKTILAILIFDLFFIASVNLKNTYLAIYTNGDLISQLLIVIEYIILLLIIPFSLLFTVLVLVKIIKKSKYQNQQKHHKTQIINATIRIVAVLVFQCITLIILFAFTSVYNFPMEIIPPFNNIIFKLPLIVQAPPALIRGFKNNQKCINVIRVFIDSIVVLVVLSGYRRSILGIFERLCTSFKNGLIKKRSKHAAVIISRSAARDICHR